MALDPPIGTLHERIEGMDSRALGWTIEGTEQIGVKMYAKTSTETSKCFK